MDLPELHTHSFIVKIWLETPPDGAHPAAWRGHITHVPSGRRRYLRDLEAIRAFISPYLNAMGVKRTPRTWIGQWLSRLKL